MKYLLLFILVVSMLSPIKAQTTLRYNTNGLQVGDKAKTTVAKYINEGASGKNVVWDFSKLNCIGPHYASTVSLDETPYAASYPKANVVIQEHGNHFFYTSDNESTKLHGYINNNLMIKYNTPITKMKYPFHYGDKFDGKYSGETQISIITGEYTVEADALGTLKLPGSVLKNVLRVKAYDHHIEAACNTIEVETTKYLWYEKKHRYPVMVTVIRKVYPAGGEPFVKKYTVFSDDISAEMSLKKRTDDLPNLKNMPVEYKVFPNPYVETVNIKYELTKDREVTLEAISLTGQKISIVEAKQQVPGNYTFTFSPKAHNLKAGTYFIKLMFDDKVYLEKVIGIE